MKMMMIILNLVILMGCGTVSASDNPDGMKATEYAEWLYNQNPFPDSHFDQAVTVVDRPFHLAILFSTKNVRPEKMQAYSKNIIKKILKNRDEIDYVSVDWTHLREGKWDPFELRIGATVGQLDDLDSPDWRNEIDRYIDY